MCPTGRAVLTELSISGRTAAAPGGSPPSTSKSTPKQDLPGLDIHILPGTKGETVSIPACVTHGDVDDLVYNDFYVGDCADVTIVAGCGVHTENGEPARHNGIHRFFLEKGARVKYIEKHVGTGKGEGIRSIDPVTECFLRRTRCWRWTPPRLAGWTAPPARPAPPWGRGQAGHPGAAAHRGAAAGPHGL